MNHSDTENLKKMSRAFAVLLNTAETKSSIAERMFKMLKLFVAEKKHSASEEELNSVFNFFHILSDSENNRVFFNIFIRKKYSASEEKLSSVLNSFHTL